MTCSERATPDVIEENKAEITRLQRVVRQLEAMIAERDAERAMYFPPTPPQDPVPGSGAHDFGDWEDIEAFFDPTDADSETSNQPAPFSNQLPPLNFDYRNESYTFPGQPQSPLEPLEPVWPPRSCASTWPQRAVPFQPHDSHPPPCDPSHGNPLPLHRSQSISGGASRTTQSFDQFARDFEHTAEDLPVSSELPQPSLPFDGINYFVAIHTVPSSSSQIVHQWERANEVSYDEVQFF